MAKNILVTGANGQLGKSLQFIESDFSDDFRFVFTDVAELDITDKTAVLEFGKKMRADFIVNAAAYTAVDKAESDVAKAYLLNETAVRNLAEVAAEIGAMLVHISTDYVFNGKSRTPYAPDMQPDPVSIYGKSKWAGEQAIHASGCRAAIIRTAWLYSPYGNNFVKTMLRLAESKEKISVVSDQIGCPTLAGDLARFIMRVLICENRITAAATYHFANRGQISWFEFAQEIIRQAVKLGAKDCPVVPITTADYPTPASRPNFSVFDLSKTTDDFDFDIPDWKESLTKELPKIYHNYKNNIV
ncbi:MAG: dTDP-4-dehydrorhamnose reductase [Bacteroidales bacterium]|nr:dTDP-4-dehydrorhamnose reductase [Bacteroidales bacterium]